MKCSALRRISLFALSLGIAACGAGDHSAPLAPTSAEVLRSTRTAAPESSPGISMPVTSSGAKPAGFEAIFHVDPKPDIDGIIRGDSPLTVEFDVCGSRTGANEPLTYLYDWDFDHVADVVGTGDACHQEHTYSTRRLTDAKGNVLFETNVCVVSGDRRVPSAPETFFSCRTFRISLPAPSQPTNPFLHHTGYGQQWTDGVPTGTYDLAQATRACEEYVLANPGFSCGQSSNCCAGSACTFSALVGGGPLDHFWLYSGLDAYVGQTTDSDCLINGLVWD